MNLQEPKNKPLTPTGLLMEGLALIECLAKRSALSASKLVTINALVFTNQQRSDPTGIELTHYPIGE